MRTLVLCLVAMLSACAHDDHSQASVTQTSALSSASSTPLTFTKLKGKPLTVLVLDHSGLFDGHLAALEAAQKGVENQLRESGVMVTTDAPSTLTVDVYSASSLSPGSTTQCLRAEGHLGVSNQAFIPTQGVHSVVHCAGNSQVEAKGDVIGALWAVGAYAIHTANGGVAKERAEALFSSVADVLVQVDARSRQ